MENEVGDMDLEMDLDLNLGLPPVPSDILDLERDSGMNFDPNDVDPILWIHRVSQEEISGEDPSSVNGSVSLETEACIRHAHAHAHARHRWRRREMRRIRPTVLDLPNHGTGANGSVGHLLIFSPVEESVFGNSVQNPAVVNCDVATERKSYEKSLIEKALAEDSVENRKEAESNFECNVCLDLAVDPVVTSCGHLFCWPCLYQWVHVHSTTKECPVCKGEVTDNNVMPIYGRGSNNSNTQEPTEGKGEGNSGRKGVPPRPQGFRIESLRQRIFRSMPRRVARSTDIRDQLNARIASSEGRDANPEPEEQRTEDMIDGLIRHRITNMPSDGLIRHRISNMPRDMDVETIASRSRARRRVLLRSSGATVEYRTNPAPVVSEVGDELAENPVSRNSLDDPWRLLSFSRIRGSDGLGPSPDFDAVSMLRTFVHSGIRTPSQSEQAGNSSSNASANNRDVHPDADNVPSDDRGSVSSTVAVIQGSTSVPDGLTDPGSIGSSTSARRRQNNGASTSTSTSAGVGDAVIHVAKRRRIN